MRLFIAVLPDDNIMRALLDTQKALRNRHFHGTFTEKQNLHLTVRFIGEYSDPDFVTEQMEQIPFTPFPLTLNGYLGNFGNLLWAGIAQNPALEQYNKRLTHQLAGCGIPFDKKRFHPHITLLRNASGKLPFSDIVIPQESMTVRRISLMRSDFGKHGAQYTELSGVQCPHELH